MNRFIQKAEITEQGFIKCVDGEGACRYVFHLDEVKDRINREMLEVDMIRNQMSELVKANEIAVKKAKEPFELLRKEITRLHSGEEYQDLKNRARDSRVSAEKAIGEKYDALGEVARIKDKHKRVVKNMLSCLVRSGLVDFSEKPNAMTKRAYLERVIKKYTEIQ